ncbi:circularly permuted type 2 ATP-grasp protein [Luteimicrobium subarcticum]|uniref:Putative circularly permuted ATP-grasp superfamily protein n=1 Tax=Luteimicrobium subarcticum TaxID=620910 RepID=A0A2M8W3F2_9MICO|nr:circularly permuted type 2 ATP-grasp protein [Luteimicrobium subarcticum]PJI85462.1 putative circularly permuted ATP-grasp superfamily protein [Luteimicrobium subarcticum]
MSQVLDPPAVPDDVAALGRQVRELVVDRGVTTSDGTRERPWRLDPLPWRVDAAEWEGVAAGVAQRAELLDAVLADVYGPRRLLRSGLVPPRLVLGDAGFLPALDGVRLSGPRQLVQVAVDVARTPAGWQVLADRTQAPSGAGYAMEGRRIVSQVCAGSYRQSAVLRVGPYFQALREALQATSPDGAQEPRVAILTPGPRSATAFDQAFSAAHLGIPLVGGRDLVVREGRVWLRGLEGLEPVDVLWRRVDGADCDPLDLVRGSRLGVPGLVRAVRGGGVSVVNPLGAAVLENPALGVFLPAACRALRDEELLLGGPATYWCGDPAARSHVVTHLADLVVKSTDRAVPGATVRGWTLSAAERADLVARIGADPDAWVGQEPVHPDRTPTLTAGGVHDRETVLRTFAVAAPEGYRLMTGGLALASPTDVTGALISHTAGAIAKDLWVVAAAPDDTGTGAGAGTGTDDPTWEDLVAGLADAPERSPLRVSHPGSAPALSPRAAESWFWLGRYAERAACGVRLLRVVQDRHRDFQHRPHTPGGVALDVLLTLLEDETVPGGPGVLLGRRDLDGTIAADVDRLVACCFDVRDQLPADTWLATSALERALDAADAAAPQAPLHELLDALGEGLLALAGISAESLVRDVGWHLLQAGRRLERAAHLARTLATSATVRPDAVESLVLDSLLVAHDSVLTYRRRHQARPDLASVLGLLVLDGTNPRSLAAQVAGLHDAFAHVPGDAARTDLRARLLGDLDDLLAEADPDALAGGADGSADGDGAGMPPAAAERTRLAELLESVRWRLDALADDTTRLVTPESTSLDLDLADPGDPSSPQDPR